MSTVETSTTGAPNNATGPANTVVVPEKPDTTTNSAAEQKPVTPTTAQRSDDAKVPEKSGTSIHQLWKLAQTHTHREIWGVTLADPDHHIPSQIVLQKFLNAYDGDITKAKETLTNTLDWRQTTKPLDLLSKAHAKGKFDGLGYVTSYGTASPGDTDGKEVFTWNIYGGVKDIATTFGDLNEFIAWRVALMELALQELNLSAATKPITAEHDPYKIYQVHDYKNISFFRSPPQVKSASTETIKVFAANYPELLKEKFFVNVPAIMGFVYGFMKLFVAAKTIKKFHPMSNGKAMVHEFGESKVSELGKQLPPDYGGDGAELPSTGKQVHLE